MKCFFFFLFFFLLNKFKNFRNSRFWENVEIIIFLLHSRRTELFHALILGYAPPYCVTHYIIFSFYFALRVTTTERTDWSLLTSPFSSAGLKKKSFLLWKTNGMPCWQMMEESLMSYSNWRYIEKDFLFFPLKSRPPVVWFSGHLFHPPPTC